VTDGTRPTAEPTATNRHPPRNDEEEQVVQQIRAWTGYVVIVPSSAMYYSTVESNCADDSAARKRQRQQQERQRRFRRHIGNGPDIRKMERKKIKARYERNKKPFHYNNSSTSSVFYRSSILVGQLLL
jgi:hypothetical protein